MLIAQPLHVRGQETAVLPVTVNSVPQGEAVVILGERDTWIEVDLLERAGVILGDAGVRKPAAGRTVISLASLAPLVSYELDEAALQLNIQVDPQLFEIVRLSRGGKPS